MSAKQCSDCSPFLNVSPSELEFLFEIKKQSYCFMQLTNKTPRYVAFKISTTDPNEYIMRPSIGIVSPGAKCDIRVLMRATQEAPADMQCKDNFMVQSVVVAAGTTKQDINPKLFDKVRRIVGEFKVNAKFTCVNPTSPVPEPKVSEEIEGLQLKDAAPLKEHLPNRSVLCLTKNKLVKKIKKVALGDNPHPRHLCVVLPFDKTPHEIHCKMCYCYLCDQPAPCMKWAKKDRSIFNFDLSIGSPESAIYFNCYLKINKVATAAEMHCHATEDMFWKTVRDLELSKTKLRTK